MVCLRERSGWPECVAVTLLIVGASLNAASATQAAAQGERVVIRTVPSPDQVVVTRSTQDITMNLEGQPGLPVNGVIVNKTTFATTMKAGSPNAQGQTEVRYTLDTFNIETTFNGAPMPVGNVGRDLAGQTVSITFDDADHVVDVQASNPMLRPLLSSGFFSVPKMTLAIGESTSVRNQMPIPLPAATSLNATLESTYTLQSVTTEPAGRVAHLGIAITGGMEQAAAPAGSPMSITVTVSGNGTMDVNLDAGYVLRQDTNSTFDAEVHPPSAAGSSPPAVKLHGTMKMTSQADAPR